MRTLLFLLLMATPALGQTVELIYLPTEVATVVKYKKELPGEIGATNALSLRNISDKRKDAYVDKIASSTAAVVFGDGALKAVSEISFPIPLFIVNGDGDTSAKAGVIVLLDGKFKGSAGDAATISNLADIPAINPYGKVMLNCRGVEIVDVLNAMISKLE